MKKAISLILTFLLWFQIPSFVCAGDSPTSDSQTEIEFLTALDAIPEWFSADSTLTRGEFSAMVADLLYQDIEYQTIAHTLYSDVPADHKYAKEILILKAQGIVSGDKNGNFYPDREILYQDAITILLNAMGYAPFAVNKGGYPSGYLVTAVEEGFFKGISRTDGLITGSSAAKMLYNALFAASVEVVTIWNGEVSVQINRAVNLMQSRLGIVRYDAVLVNDGLLSSDDSGTLSDGKVMIRTLSSNEKIILDGNGSGIANYLGYRLEVFVKPDNETDKRNVIYCKPHKNVTVQSVLSTKLVSASENYLEYEYKEGEYKKLSMGSAPYQIYFNGKRQTSFDLQKLTDGKSHITFINNGNDSCVNILWVVQFQNNLIVDSIDSEKGRIFCKMDAGNNLDFSDESDHCLRLIKDGKQIQPDAVKNFDVLSVAKTDVQADGKQMYLVYVSQNTVESIVEGIQRDEEKLSLNGQEYKVSKEYLQKNASLFAGLSYDKKMVFRLDCMGEIAYIDQIYQDTSGFSYLIDMEPSDSLEEEIRLKYFSYQEKAIKISALSPKASIDGKTLTGTADEAFSQARILLCTRPDGTVEEKTKERSVLNNQTYSCIIPRPALIQTDSKGVIKKIETDAVTYDDPAQENAAGNILRAGERCPGERAYQSANMTFQGQFLLSKETLILQVPDIDRYHLEEEIKKYTNNSYSRINTNIHELDLHDENNYKALKASDLDGDMRYDLQAYNIDPNTGIAKFAVVRGALHKTYGYQENTALSWQVFLKWSVAYDEKTERLIKKIYYYDLGSGATLTAFVDEDVLHPWYRNLLFGGKTSTTIQNAGTDAETTSYIDVLPVSKGDLISVAKKDGMLTHIQRDVDLDRINYKRAGSYRSSSPSSPYSSAAYSITNVAVPFDMRELSNYSYDGTYNFFLGAAMERNGSKLKLRIPYKANASQSGTWQDYINDAASAAFLDIYLDLSKISVSVIEEISCDCASGNCDYKVKQETISDIITADSIGENPERDGMFKASRIFCRVNKGTVAQLVLFNLKETHNRYLK